MNKLNRILATVLLLTIAFGGSVSSYARQASQKPSVQSSAQQKVILEECRSAVLELKFAREKEVLLQKQVAELKAVNSTQAEQVDALFKANAKWEAATVARTQAEALVSELRANYDKQMAQAEKQLATANLKTRFWQVLAGVALVVGFVLGSKQ